MSDSNKYIHTDVLSDVIKSGVIGKSKNQYNLLKFLLERYNDGTGATLREHTIAIQVMGRAETFTPSLDGIVRVEMYRLRKNLSIFNLHNHAFKIHIPKGSYEIVITPNDDIPQAQNIAATPPETVPAHPPSFFQKHARGAILALALALVSILNVFYAKKPHNMPAQPASEQVVSSVVFPRLKVSVNWTTDFPGEIIVEQHVTRALSRVPVKITESPDYDYTLNLLAGKLPNGLIRVNLSLVEAKSDYVFDESFECECQSLSEIESELTAIIDKQFKVPGSVPTHHAYNNKVSANRQKLYRCMYDMDNFAFGRSTHFHKPEELEDCLDPSTTNNPFNLTSIYSHKSALYFEGLAGKVDFGISDAELRSRLEDSIDHAKNYTASRSLAYYFNMRLVLLNPDNDPQKVRLMLSEAEKSVHSNPGVFLMGAVYAYTLGDWENAKRIADLPINQIAPERGRREFLMLPEAIANQDIPEVSRMIERLNDYNSRIVGLSNIWLGCRMSNPDKIARGEEILKNFGPDITYRNLLDRGNYAPALTQSLSDLGNSPLCQAI